MESNVKKKKIGPKRLINAAKNSFSGLTVAYLNEPSLKMLFLLSILLIIGGFAFQISRIEWLFIVLMIGCCFAAELLNTAIENTVDLAIKEIHPLAKIAKDTASAAEFVFVLMSFIMTLLIFIPKILVLF